MTTLLTPTDLSRAATILANSLSACGVTYGIIGGAGVALHAFKHHIIAHPTADIDAIIHPDTSNNITAESIAHLLPVKFPEHFITVSQYGVQLPAIRLLRDAGSELIVEIELFDVLTWPGRPQYDLTDSVKNPREALTVGETATTVYVMTVAWLLREKITSQAQREGSKKEHSDILDVECLATIAGDDELVCDSKEFAGALRRLLKKPGLEEKLRRVVKCSSVFP